MRRIYCDLTFMHVKPSKVRLPQDVAPINDNVDFNYMGYRHRFRHIYRSTHR